MNLRRFKLYRVHLEPFNSSNVGDVSWSCILKGFIHVQIEKGKFVVLFPLPPLIKCRIGRFHVVVVQWTSKKCTKKRDARCCRHRRRRNLRSPNGFWCRHRGN